MQHSLDENDTFSEISRKNKHNNQLIEKAARDIKERKSQTVTRGGTQSEGRLDKL